MASWSRWVAIAGIVLSTVACDRASKGLAERYLIGQPRRSYLADTVRVEYSENRGGFLSLGAGLPQPIRTGLFTLGTAVFLAAVGVVLTKPSTSRTAMLGLSFLWAGGASNLIDRLLRGSVVDFLNLGIGAMRTGIFNLADVAIMLGCLAVIASSGPVRTGS